MNRRDGKGGFLLGSQYWQAAGSVRNAYIVWGLVETGEVNLQRELTRVVRGALDGQNAYVMALALLSDAKLHPQSDRCKSLGKKLLGTKQADGQFRGLEEWATVFGSRGRAAAVETTALALLALKRAGFGLHPDSIEWLRAQRHGSGYGGTQATVLALKALTNAQFAGGRLEFQVGKLPPTKITLAKNDPGSTYDLSEIISSGETTVNLSFSGKHPLAFGLDMNYRSNSPRNIAKEPPLTLSLKPHADTLRIGDVLNVAVALQSRGGAERAMTLIHVGIPAGLRVDIAQLRQLREDGFIDFHETSPREVVFYFRRIQEKEEKRLNLHLMAEHAGSFTGLASKAYEYYASSAPYWVPPLSVTVSRD